MSRKNKLDAFLVVVACAIAFVTIAIYAVVRKPAVEPPFDDRALVEAQAPPENATGWVRDDKAVDAFKKTLAVPVFAGTPAGSAVDPLPDSAFLWHAHKKLFGVNPPVFNQNPIGSCVSFGTARAVERSLAWDIAYQHAPYEFKHVVEEVIYAGSRHEIGGDRIRPTRRDPNGDGSNGSWAAKWVTTYGVLPRGTYLDGKYVLEKYNPSLCRKWGAVGNGVPDDLEPEVKKFPTGSTAQVRNWAEAKRALANGYGVAECSDYLLTNRRDANGVVKAYEGGGHCMCLDGYYIDRATGKEYGHIENSWSESFTTGPTGWGDPNSSGGWVISSTVDNMLHQGDSWTFSSVKGFPKRELDWAMKGPVAGPEYALAP